MTRKSAKANLNPVRQRTQYTCMSTSMCMALNALGHECDEDEVNKVMGARPMKGAAWEQALACAQHYGVRGTLVCPSTVNQLKEWCDAGKPVMIAWNPEGREWSHASVVFDVTEDPEHGLMVHVADPNIPDPDETVRVVPKGEFYQKWYEKWPNYLVRRPALMLDREITPEGRQVMASRFVVSPEQQKARDYAAQNRKKITDLLEMFTEESIKEAYQIARRFLSLGVERKIWLLGDRSSGMGAKSALDLVQKTKSVFHHTEAVRAALSGDRARFNEMKKKGKYDGWVWDMRDLERFTRFWNENPELASLSKSELKMNAYDFGELYLGRSLMAGRKKSAARRGPPSQTASAALLKRKGYTQVNIYLDDKGKPTVARDVLSPPTIVMQGDGLQDRTGKLFLFAGLAGDGSPILAKDDRELERLTDQIIKDRLHVVTAAAKRGRQVMESMKKSAAGKDYTVEIVQVSGPNVTLKGRGRADIERGMIVPAAWLPVNRPKVGDEFFATPTGDRRRPWAFTEMSFDIVAASKRVVARLKKAEPYDCYRDGLRGRELADCYKMYPNDLGPDDIAFIQRYYPGWSPGGGYSRSPSRPRVPKTEMTDAEYKKHREDIVALRLALAADPKANPKAKKFVKDIAYKSSLSDKQKQWRDRLLRQYSRFIGTIPDKVLKSVSYNQYGAVYYFGGLGDKKVEDWVDTHWQGWRPERGGISPGAPRPRPEKPKRERAAPAAPKERHTWDRTKTDAMIVILDTLIDKGGPKSGMLRGFKADLESGKGLTEGQLKAIRHNLYQNRMRSEADQFRLASAGAVAQRYLGAYSV